MLTLNLDEKSVYTVDTPIHTHPPHDTIISTLKRRNAMREAAKKRRTSLATTRSIATEVRETDSTVRRLSTDLRFIRRFRQGNVCPKFASDIVLNEQTSPFVLFHTPTNETIIFGVIDMVRAATTVSFIRVDGTFSRCPRHIFSLSHATLFVGMGSHSRSRSLSFPIKNPQHTQLFLRQSMRLPKKNVVRRCFQERI